VAVTERNGFPNWLFDGLVFQAEGTEAYERDTDRHFLTVKAGIVDIRMGLL